MTAVGVLARHTLREQGVSRPYHLIVVFGGVLIYASLLFGAMAVDQASRVLLDFGLALIELFTLAAAVHGAATTILREIDQKTLYLILTRPVSKDAYLAGRYLGLLLSSGAAMLVMALLHLALLRAKGAAFVPAYPVLLFGSFLKVALMAALATLLALFSTSVLTALNLTFVLWVLGHFMSEARFLIGRLSGPAAWLSRAAILLVPNLQLLNFKDRWEAPGALTFGGTAWAAGYAAVYASACLGLAMLLFRRKEF